MTRHVPVNQITNFLNDSSLIHTSGLRELSDLRVGIDTTTWIRTQLKLPVLEALQPAMGGIPISFEQAILKSISSWKTSNITPLFVFQGLSILRDKKTAFYFGSEQRSFKRKVAWEQYTSRTSESGNFSAFQDDSLLSFTRSLFPVFIQNNVQYVVAPYLASPQLAWFSEQKLTQAVYGGYELLPYASSISKLITSIDFKKQTYTWISPKEVFTALDATPEQFIDAYLLCSVENKSTLQENVELIKQHGRGSLALQKHYSGGIREKLNNFLKSKALINFAPIINARCQCEPFKGDKVPNDLHDLFGPRMPSDIYFCISQAVVSTQVINPLLQGELIEVPPLVDSQEYRQILTDLIFIRSRTLALLIFPLHYQFVSREVKTLRWFDEAHKALDLSAHYNKIAELTWNLPVPVYEKERKRQTGKQMDMNFIVKFLLHNTLDSTKTTKSSSTVNSEIFSSEDQIIGQVILHSFSLLGFTETELEKKTYMGALSYVSPNNQPYALLVLELLHYKNLSGNPFNFTDLKHLPNMTEDPNILLISRVLSLLPMNFKKDSAWTGLVDHDLLAFNCILKALGRSVRGMFEMVLLGILLRTKVQIDHNRYSAISQRLPFYQENNTALGIVMKEFLMNEQQANSKVSIVDRYPCCVSPLEDLKKGIQFWNEIVLMVKELSSQNLIEADSLSQFENADAFLKKRQSALH